MKYLLILLIALASVSVSAETIPSKGLFDSRVRVVDYNPMEVIKIITFYGVSTHVQFGDAESIKDVAVGDDQAWNIVPRGNHLFIKPKAKKADTNVTVVTDKRVYNFALVVQPRSVKDSSAWRDPNLIYGLSFRYPEEEAAKREEEIRQANIKAQKDSIKSRLSGATKGAGTTRTGDEGEVQAEENLDYWVAGSPEISPTAARDDGRFTYLQFSNNRDMPAVYSVDAEGKEALINTNVEGNTIIIHRVVPKLTLRKGGAVACIRNNAFDLDGGRDNTSGTIAPEVKRVTKDGEDEKL